MRKNVSHRSDAQGQGGAYACTASGAKDDASAYDKRESGIADLRSSLAPGDVLQYPVPDGLEDKARLYLEDPSSFEVAEPRLASTVMLLRTSEAGELEVFMLRRASTMAFVPDACVFPGGSADARDDAYEVPLAGPGLDEWARVLGCDEASARRALITAVRELFEECGVLLAADDAGDLVRDEGNVDRHQEDRRLLASHEISFGEYLTQRGLTLRSDLLCARAHWTTPPCEPRRYSTYFFTARLPEGQQADGLTSEAVRSGWVRPADMLAQGETGAARVMPPTIANLSDLLRAGSVERACDAVRVSHVMLMPARLPDETVVFRSVIG